MTAEPTLSDTQLADNVRAAAAALVSAMNAAKAAGLTVDVQFSELAIVGHPSAVTPLVSVKRSQDL